MPTPAQTTEASPPDRRARRKAETRARLVSAAGKLFVEVGYHATRPQDIARAADVAVGTFYTYFEDKRDAFIAFTRDVGDDLLVQLAGAWQPTDDFEAGLGHVLETLIDYTAANPGVLRVAFGESVIASGASDDDGDGDGDGGNEPSLRDRLASGLAEALRVGVKDGGIHDDYDVDFVADAMVGLLHQGLVRADARPRAATITNLTRFCRRALVKTAD